MGWRDSSGLDVHYTTATMGVSLFPLLCRGAAMGAWYAGMGIEAPTLREQAQAYFVIRPGYRFEMNPRMSYPWPFNSFGFDLF